MRAVLPLPILLPLGAAALSMALHRRPGWQRVLGVAALAGTLAAAVALLARVRVEGPTAITVGGWPAPIGITLVADLFAAIMLVVAAAIVLAVLVYAIGHTRTTDAAPFFHPVYLILSAGIAGSFLTGDLFNLFVFFEVMLTASFVLITLGGSRSQVRSGMTYVVISLLASTLFITSVALVYAATGTINLAHLSARLDTIPDGVRTALGLLLLVVFGVKAAIFPLFFWLPDSYPTAPAPVTAVFAGLLTKVGVYAIIRTQTLLFPADGASTLLLGIAGATMVVGVLGAIAQNDVKRILSFHIISQIGYMIMGLALFSIAGLAGAIFYIVHHIVVKTTLFLVGGLVEESAGTGALDRLSGMLRRTPLVAGLFLIAALSLAGLPPFSGFLAKLGLVEAGLADGKGAIVAVSLLVSLLTLYSMSKIWAGAFWGRVEPVVADRGVATRLSAPMVGATVALAALSVAVAAAGGPLYDLTLDAAASLLDPHAYVEVVLGQ